MTWSLIIWVLFISWESRFFPCIWVIVLKQSYNRFSPLLARFCYWLYITQTYLYPFLIRKILGNSLLFPNIRDKRAEEPSAFPLRGDLLPFLIGIFRFSERLFFLPWIYYQPLSSSSPPFLPNAFEWSPRSLHISGENVDQKHSG